jgi:hypothetical protein
MTSSLIDLGESLLYKKLYLEKGEVAKWFDT